MENLQSLRRKRGLAVILALAVLFTYSLPIPAFAQTSPNNVAHNGDIKTSDDGAVTVSKTATQVGENEFDITLKIQAKDGVETTTQAADAAVVLVMDVSGSMSQKISGDKARYEYESRLYQAKEKVKDFLKSYVADAGDTARNISIVIFGSAAKVQTGWINANAGIDLSTKQNIVSQDIINVVDGIGGQWKYSKERRQFVYSDQLGSGTNVEGGMALAKNLISQAVVKDAKSKNVVLITDGAPTVPVESVTANSASGDSRHGAATNPEDYDDIQGFANDIKEAGASVYTILYALNNTNEKVYQSRQPKSWQFWLSFDETHKYSHDLNLYNFYNGIGSASLASDTNVLAGVLETLKTNIDTQLKAEGLTVTDPMGTFINFDKDSIKNRQDAEFENDILTWKPVAPTNASTDGTKNYILKYKVKFDTEKEGFKDFDESGNPVEYPTNGTTTLTYTYKGVQKTIDFDVPRVIGEIPKVDYSVEYYKLDKATGKYPDTPTDKEENLQAKLWTTVDAPQGYADKYSKENYHFEKGDSKLQIEKLVKNGENVIKLFYKPDVAKVKVEHWYKTDVIDVNGKKIPANGYTLESSPEKELYVGDKFTAPEVPKDGHTLNVTKSDKKEITVSKNGNTIKLYYDGTDDQRRVGSVKVNEIFKTGKWEIGIDGRYHEKFVSAEPKLVSEDKNVRIPSDFQTAIKSKEETKGYIFEGTDIGTADLSKNVVNARLVAKDTVINLTYVKHAQQTDLIPAKITVKHVYKLTEKTVTAGSLKVETKTFEDPKEIKGYYAKEKFTPVEQLEYKGITYEADKSNADKLKQIELLAENDTIVLSYHQVKAPDTTEVTVNHIYRTYENQYVEVKDAEGNVIGHELKKGVLVNEQVVPEQIKTCTYEGKEEKLYAGMLYTAVLNGKYSGVDYVINNQASTPGYKIDRLSANAMDNAINLYYDLTEDNRADATLTVNHKYITKKKVVKAGKLSEEVTVNAENGQILDADKDNFSGKAGDTFTVTPQYGYDYDGAGEAKPETYNLVGYVYDGKEHKVDKDHPFKADFQAEPGSKTLILIYEFDRDTKDLKSATLNVFHKYIKKVMKIVKGKAKYEAQPAVDGETDKITGKFEKQVVQINLKPEFAGEKYTPATDNPATNVELNAGENNVTYNYVKEETLPKVSVKVIDHYTDTYFDEVGKESEETFQTSQSPREFYVGEQTETKPVLGGYTLQTVKVFIGKKEVKPGEGTALNDLTISEDGKVLFSAPDKDVTIRYFYSRVTDKSVAANWTVNHYYRTLDWNETNDKKYTFRRSDQGSSFATLSKTATPDLRLDTAGNPTYTLDKATYDGPTEIDKDKYTVKLVKGENVINFYYTQKIDTRKAATVIVEHNYYKHDTSGIVPNDVDDKNQLLPGVLAGTYVEVFTGVEENAWIGNKFVAEPKLKYGPEKAELDYTLVNPNPENLTIEVLAEDNKIVINYVYNYDAKDNMKFIIKHVYKRGSAVEEETVIAQRPNTDNGTWNDVAKTFTAKPIQKTGYYVATAESAYSNVPYAEGVKEIVIEYNYNSGGGGSSGGGGKSGNGSGTTTIEDNKTPLADAPVEIPDNEVPLANAPAVLSDNQELEILDGAVPLAGLPKTGGVGAGPMMFFGAMVVLVGLFLGRRKEQ